MGRPRPAKTPVRIIPADRSEVTVRLGERELRLTNLRKPFWPDLGLTKGDLLEYYARISSVLLPHIRDRAMVMKRYPNGAGGDFFFMKRAPTPRPDWVRLCPIEHEEGNVIPFPVVDDLPTLLWIVNLGCIDLNPWYARCDAVDQPDVVHFDLDPVKGEPAVPFARVRAAALLVRDALQALSLPSVPKTTGSRGIHVYVPIVRGPSQKDVWSFSKRLADALATLHPNVLTSEYKIARRPAGRVLVDYNQNAWGRTLASVYSVRPHPGAAVSTPVTWEEVEAGFEIADFHIGNVPDRVAERGDLFEPVVARQGRVHLEPYL
jgi:bifunctional non-homologous end joining protein LigD